MSFLSFKYNYPNYNRLLVRCFLNKKKVNKLIKDELDLRPQITYQQAIDLALARLKRR